MKNKERIVIFGKVKHSELPKYYSSADCMVFPTLSEGFPKVLIEAMACECPVIATNIPGNNEILNNTTGYPVEPNNSEQIRDAILRVMQNPGEAKQKAKKAAGIVKTKFTWEEAAKKYAQLYKKLLL
jgi:glycosyltransferase involved in cell wall biosynthesis